MHRRYLSTQQDIVHLWPSIPDWPDFHYGMKCRHPHWLQSTRGKETRTDTHTKKTKDEKSRRGNESMIWRAETKIMKFKRRALRVESNIHRPKSEIDIFEQESHEKRRGEPHCSGVWSCWAIAFTSRPMKKRVEVWAARIIIHPWTMTTLRS